MKKFLTVLFLMLFIIACSDDNKRPSDSSFSFKIEGTTFLQNADITIYDEDGETVGTGTTDDEGVFEIDDIKTPNIIIKACNGNFVTTSGESVTFAGCLQNSAEGVKDDMEINIDFLTTLANFSGSKADWENYIDIENFIKPEEDTTALTDAMKEWLWHQGLINYAGKMNVSTETLFNKIVADLTDDNIINGSTQETVGNDKIGANTFRINILENMPSTTFSTSTWKENLATAEASFLAATGENEDKITVTIQNPTSHTAQDVYAGSIEVIAKVNFTVAGELKCAIDSNEEAALITTDSENYKTIIDITELENGSHTVTCEASNSETTITGTADFTADADAPAFIIQFYEAGTNTVTGETEENSASDIIDIKAEATHSAFAVESLYCGLKESDSFTDTDTTENKLKSSVDTTTFPEGENIVICTATVNGADYTAEKSLFVKNKVTVILKGYIANPIQDGNNLQVVIEDEAGIKTLATNTDGVLTAELQKSKTYTFTLTGGKYLALGGEIDDIRNFSGELIARKTITATTATIVITPLTTVHEYIRQSIVLYDSSITDADATATEWLQNRHYGSGEFNYNLEPVNNQTIDTNTKSYLANGGFDLLARYIEKQEELTEGTISTSNILSAIKEDLTGDRILNGNTGITISGFVVDSYLFRMHYASALKVYMESNENLTGQVIIALENNPALDNSPLFPSDETPIPINIDGVEITDIQYKMNLSTTETTNWTDYADLTTTDNPVFQKEFVIKFRLVPNTEDGQKIDPDSINLIYNKDFTITEITKEKETGVESYFCEYKISAKEETNILEKDEVLYLTLELKDLAGNLSQKSIKTDWDTIAPIIEITVPETPVTPANATWTWEITDNNYYSSKYVYTNPNEDITTNAICNVSGNESLYNFYTINTMGEEGSYSITVNATDKAGNTSDASAKINIDSTPPELQISIADENQKELQNSEWTNSNEVHLIESNNDTAEIKYTLYCNNNSYIDQGYTTTKTYDNTELPNSTVSNCKLILYGKDSAGNESEPIVRQWLIDTEKPQLSNIAGIAEETEYHSKKTVNIYVNDELSGVESVSVQPSGYAADVCNNAGDYYECEIGVSGVDDYNIIVTDNVGNSTSVFKRYLFDFSAPDNITINRTETYCIDSNVISWTVDTTTVDVSCSVQKKGSSSNYTTTGISCTNGENIASKLTDSGIYRIALTVKYKDGTESSISYSEAFNYFNVNDIEINFNVDSISYDPVAYTAGNTYTYNDNYNTGLNLTYSTDGLAKISQIKVYFLNPTIYGEDTIAEKLAFTVSPGNTDGTIKTLQLNSQLTGGKYTKVRMDITYNNHGNIESKLSTQNFYVKEQNEVWSINNFVKYTSSSPFASGGTYIFKFDFTPYKYQSVNDSYLNLSANFSYYSKMVKNSYSDIYLWKRNSYTSPTLTCSSGECSLTVYSTKYQYNNDDGWIYCGTDSQCGCIEYGSASLDYNSCVDSGSMTACSQEATSDKWVYYIPYDASLLVRGTENIITSVKFNTAITSSTSDYFKEQTDNDFCMFGSTGF